MARGVAFSSASARALPNDYMTVYQLPEDHTDFIFCVLGERFGLPGRGPGAVALRLARLAERRPWPWKRAEPVRAGLMAAGVTGPSPCKSSSDTGVTVGLLPVTGLPLPHGQLWRLASPGPPPGNSACVLNVALRPGYEVTNEPFRHPTSAVG